MIYMSLGMHLEKKGGVTGSWLYVRKRGGGGIEVRTGVQSAKWGVGGLEIGKKCVCN